MKQLLYGTAHFIQKVRGVYDVSLKCTKQKVLFAEIIYFNTVDVGGLHFFSQQNG